MIPLAHAGHVLLDLLYAAPLLIMVGLLVVGKMREKRARDGISRRLERGICAAR